MNMEFTEMLISLVRQHPCLYDCRVKDYKNVLVKERMWDMIANELNQTSDNIKMKWKNLKDGYAKYRKKKNKYGNWVWGPYLTFLEGAAAIKNMPMEGSGDALDSSNNEGKDAKVEVTYNTHDGNEVIDVDDTPLNEFLTLRDPLSTRFSRKRQGSEAEYAEERDSNIRKDSIDLLFESYAKSLKQMKPKTQARLKIRLAQMFADAELEDIHTENTNEEMRNNLYSVMNTANGNDVMNSSHQVQ